MTNTSFTLRAFSALAITAALASGFALLGTRTATAEESGRGSTGKSLPVIGVKTEAAPLNQDLTSLVAKLTPAFVLFPSGSGVCISPDGYVLTNHHVAPEATRRYTMDTAEDEVTTRVSMAMSGRDLVAKPVGANPRGDIVLMKLELGESEVVPYVDLGDSDNVEVGDVAIAIGNPFLLSGFAFEPSVSVGVISAKGRFQGGYTNAIQIDAALNPGNSGGPLFNNKGQLIGINGRILTSHGQRYNTGAGFAIPVNQIKRFVDVWKSRDNSAIIARHGIISGLALTHAREVKGATVASVREGYAAAIAGLKGGDVIAKVEGKNVRGASGFYNLIGEFPQDSMVKLSVLRNGATVEFEAVLDAPVTLNQAIEWPRSDDTEEDRYVFQKLPTNLVERAVGSMAPNPFAVRPPSAALGISPGHSAGNPLERGIEVVSFVANSQGVSSNANSVLQVGDVITHIGGVRVRYRANLVDVMLGYKVGQEVPVTVLRGGEKVTVKVKTGRSANVRGSGPRTRRGG